MVTTLIIWDVLLATLCSIVAWVRLSTPPLTSLNLAVGAFGAFGAAFCLGMAIFIFVLELKG